MDNFPDLQETRKLEAVKSFEGLTEEQKIKIENDLIWRFLEKYYRKIYRQLFAGICSHYSEAWLRNRIWKGDGSLPKKYQTEMTHFREVLTRLRNTTFIIDTKDEVQFDLEAVLSGQQTLKEDDLKALESLQDANWEMDFSEMFIDEDEDGQPTRPLNPVPKT